MPRARPVALMLLLAVATTAADDPAPFRPAARPDGVLVLPADRARWRGDRLKLVADPGYLAGWTDPADAVAWEFLAPKAGPYLVIVEYAAPTGRGDCLYEVRVGEQVRQGYVHPTGDATTFLPQPLMTSVDLKPGLNRLAITPREVPHGFVMNLRRVRLVPDRED